MTKKKTNREMKTVEKTVYSPLYFVLLFFFCGGQRVQEPAQAHDVRARGSWLQSLFDPSHTSLPLPLPLSLSVSFSF